MKPKLSEQEQVRANTHRLPSVGAAIPPRDEYYGIYHAPPVSLGTSEQSGVAAVAQAVSRVASVNLSTTDHTAKTLPSPIFRPTTTQGTPGTFGVNTGGQQALVSASHGTSSTKTVGSKLMTIQGISQPQNATSHGNTLIGSTASTSNEAFSLALERHKLNLTEEERKAFSPQNVISPEMLLHEVGEFDRQHKQDSTSRKCAEQVKGFLDAVDGYLKVLGICIQHSPEISALVVGGLRLVVDVR